MPVTTSRLGTITDIQLQAALDRFNLGHMLHAEPAISGNFGQNVFVDSTAGRLVFRGNPLRDHQFTREQFFASFIRQHTDVPGPWPYHQEADTSLFGWEYAIMPCLEGIQIADETVYNALSAANHLAIATAMGATLASLQSFQMPEALNWNAETGTLERFVHGYGSWIEGLVLANLEQSTGLRDSDRSWANDIIGKGKARGEPGSSVLVHCDFTIKNVVAAPSGEGWSISGLYDLMSCHIGDPVFDLARQFCMYVEERPPLAHAFLAAYRECAPDIPDLRERLRFFILNERLGIWEWAKRTDFVWWDQALSLQDWIEGFFAHIPSYDNP